MPFPIFLRVGSLQIHPHLLFEALAYTVGFRLYLAGRKWRGDFLQDYARWWVLAAATSGALLGAIFLAMLENPQYLLAHGRERGTILAGKTIVGALIGGLISVEAIKRRLGVTRRTGDLFAIPLCVGIAIGRIGCFLTGLPDQTCGIPSTLPWAVDFGDGIPRHPTQLYEIIFLGFLALLILRLSHRQHLEGDLFRLFMVGYSFFRLLCDFLKPDPGILLGLSSIQLACLCVLVFYSRDIPRLLRGLSSRILVRPIIPELSAPEASGMPPGSES